MTKNIFNLAIPISTLCIVDDKSCDSWHHPIERKWSVETGHVNVSDLPTLAEIFCNMIRSIPNKDWSHIAPFFWSGYYKLSCLLPTYHRSQLGAGLINAVQGEVTILYRYELVL